MHSSLSTKSNQASLTCEATSRRPRSSFEDASLSDDAKVNILLPEKHVHTDGNALDPSNDVPDPVHSYVRTHPYYRSSCKSSAPTTFLHPIADLQPQSRVCINSQPLATMFANMPKFDLIPNLAHSHDLMYSYDVAMPAVDRSISSTPTSVIDNDINMAYSAPAVNSISRTDRKIRSYAAVAATPSSHLLNSKQSFAPNPNVFGGSANFSNAFFDLKKSALISKKSVSRGARTKPPLQSYKMYSLPSVPESATELDMDAVDAASRMVDSAGDLEDSDIELLDKCEIDDNNSMDCEYLDLAQLHFHLDYNSRSVQLRHFLIPTTLELIAGLAGFDYLSPGFVAVQQSLESYFSMLASSLNVVDVMMPALKSGDAVIGSDLLPKSVLPVMDDNQGRLSGPNDSPRELTQSQQVVAVASDLVECDEVVAQQSQSQVNLLADKPSQQLTVEEDLLLFEAQESKEQLSQQCHSLGAVIDDMDDANINEYGDLDVTAAFVAEAINKNCIEEFNCVTCDIEVMASELIAELKLKSWFPYVTGCRCPTCSRAIDWTYEFCCFSNSCSQVMGSVTELAYHMIWHHNDNRYRFILQDLGIHDCDNVACHALVAPDRRFCYTHSLDEADIGRFQCENCNKLVDLKDSIYWNMLDFKSFVCHYFCDACAVFTKLTVLQCDLDHCGKYYKGRRAIKDWQQHMRKKHSDDPVVVKMLNLHMCMMPDCNILIEMDHLYCVNHVGSDQRPHDDFISQIKDDFGFTEDNFLCFKDGTAVDMSELFVYIAYDQHLVKSDIMRGEVARILVDAMCDLASDSSDLDYRFQCEMRGVLKMKLIPMIFYFKTYRSADYVRERDLRLGLYKKKKFRQLVDHCVQYQAKLNDRARRKLNRRHPCLPPQHVPLADLNADSVSAPKIDTDGPLDVNVAHARYSRKKTQQIDSIVSNFAQLQSNPAELTYYNWETTNDITYRIKRSVELAQLGLWKKSFTALQPTRLVDIYSNNNLKKGQSKYPKADPPKTYHTPLKDWKLSRKEVTEIFKKINPVSSSGKSGINNKLILWMINNDNQFNFVHAFILFLKKIIRIGLPSIVSRLLMHSTLILLGKAKYNIPDYDVRPIAVADVIIRLCDKVISYKLDDITRTRLVGPYQIIGKKRALEKAAVVLRILSKIQHNLDEIITVNIDASNAYNSMSRQYIWDIIKDVDIPLSNWFNFLYSHPIRLDLDCNSSILMEDALFQGLATSQDFYDTGKWRVLSLAVQDCICRLPDFKSLMELHYVDDGDTAMNYKYLDTYLECVIARYREAGITVNQAKSCVAVDTDNQTVIDAVSCVVDKYGLKVTFENNYKFLGLPYGSDDFINQWMHDKIDQLWILYRHVLHIKSNFIRFNMLQKMLQFCKFRYYLSLVPNVGDWMPRLQKLHDSVYHEYRMGMQPRPIMRHQIHMSQKAGGLGLRSPKLFKPAAEISALRGLRDSVDKHFLFLPYSYNSELTSSRSIYSTPAVPVFDWCRFLHSSDSMPYINELEDGWLSINNSLQDSINAFNGIVGPKYQYDPLVQTTHHKLIQLMDKKFRDEFMQEGSKEDIARIKCLSNNGALSWLNVPYNMNWSVEFNNQQFYLLLCLVLGAPITSNDYFCRGCEKVADKYGYHALSCVGLDGKQLFRRHDSLCNYLAKWLRQARYRIEMEARYLNKDGSWKRSLKRPGDIKILDFSLQADEARDLYLDITVGNIFAPSHLAVSQRRVGLAKQLEGLKAAKYGFRSDIKGLGYEVSQVVSNYFSLSCFYFFCHLKLLWLHCKNEQYLSFQAAISINSC